MTFRLLRRFLTSRANDPLPEPKPPAWTLLAGAPRAPGIGHNGGPPLDGIPVNAGEAATASPRDFAASDPHRLQSCKMQNSKGAHSC